MSKRASCGGSRGVDAGKLRRKFWGSGSSWLLVVGVRNIYMQRQDSARFPSAPELLKYVLKPFRDVGRNLHFIQTLFLLETARSSATICVYASS